MKATITSALAAGILAVVMAGGEVRAQGKPEAGRAPEASAPRPRQLPEHAPSPQQPDERAPSDNAPSAQDEMPAAPGGCPNPGRPLQLIV
jgi:hypothetical protein